MKYEFIRVTFRDISDPVNRKKRTCTFLTRLFTPGDKHDELEAMGELSRSAAKRGLTAREVIKSERIEIEEPKV
jgi:hypothetical protein